MPAQDPAPDFSNMFPPPDLPTLGQQSFNQQPTSPFDPQAPFKPEPLPTLGQQSFTQQPPSPFGPQPLPYGGARADGGPVQPGRAYMVGERGPEMIVPQQPGMVIPNEAIRSGSLASRPAVPVGGGNRSMAQRRLETAARRGNLRAAQTLFNAEQWGRNMGGRPMMPQQQSPMMPPLPQQSPSRQAPGAAPSSSVPAPALLPPQPMPSAPAAPMQPMPVDLSNMLPPMPMGQMPGGGFNPQAPLPPSTFMGGTGVPPPPRFNEVAAGGMNIIVDNDTGKQVAAYKPEPVRPPPTFEMRQDATGAFRQFFDGQPIPGEPTYTGQMVPGSYVRRETQGKPAPMQYIPNMPQPTEKVTVNDDGTVTRSYTQPRGQTPAPAAGGAATGASTGGAYTTPGGVKVNLVPDQASAPTMQTGQMPNVAYANDMTPEQSLAAARQEYAATGNDAALRRHFQQFPSASTRLANEEAKIWQQVAGQLNAFGNAVDDRGAARQRRDQWIDRDTAGNPII